MPKNPTGPGLEARSALGPIAQALIQTFLLPDHKVVDMERFSIALMQALYDAYALGFKDRGDVEKNSQKD